MSQLTLYLLGPPRIELDGEPVHIPRRKMVALLAYLAVTGRNHSRDSLATLLWPEYDQSSALAYLRRILSMLNRALGEGWLVIDRETAGINPDPLTSQRGELGEPSGQALWLDVDVFRRRLAACETHDHPSTEACPDCLPLLEEAVALYRDDFLAGFTLRDSPAFDEFQFFQTEGLRDELARALERLMRYHSSREEYEIAIAHARRWLALDLLHEPVHRHLMQLYVQAGQRAAALRQYQECVRILEAELGLPPAEETTSLYEQIRTGLADREAHLFPTPRPRHNLPAQSTPFVGREAVLAEVKARLEDPDCRLLTLIGPGGSGKTRLALQVAMDLVSEAQDRFEHGVFLVSLAPLRSVDAIVPTTANAVGFSFYGRGDPQQQLLDYLRQKAMLIIMDNYEHLLPFSSPPASGGDEGGADLVTEILRTAPEVKVLATSRVRLNVGGEHRFRVGGMDFPKLTPKASADASQYSAVKLFLQGARRARPGFELTDENLGGVVQICRLVEGLPLGIRLAAAWVELLTPAEIAAQIGQNLDLLETDRRDVSPRQRSMRATFDHSWRLLTERERQVFQALSVFRGGFTRSAAQEVTAASLPVLMALVNKSFLDRTPAGRYEVHELLRGYAEEKLDESPAAGEAARDRHSAYYTAALEQWEKDLKGSRYKAALAEMGVEIENARAAWDWAVERGQVERLDQALEGLSEFSWAHWRVYEAEAACRTAASRLATVASSDELTTSSGDGLRVPCPEAKVRRVLARILARQANFGGWTLDRETVSQLLRQSLALLEGPELTGQDTRAEKAFVLLQMGEAAFGLDSDLEQGRQLYEQSLALYQALGDRWFSAHLLHQLARLAWELGAYGEAKQLAEEGLAIARTLSDPARISSPLIILGYIALSLGQLEEAEHLLRESVVIYRETGGRGDIASGFSQTGEAFLWLGKLDEAHSLLEESLAIHNDLGIPWPTVSTNVRLGHTKMHLGQYEGARTQVLAGLAVLREYGGQRGTGDSFFALGSVALVEEAYAEARQLLEESAAVFREAGHRENMYRALAVLGYTARGLGQPSQAQQHLSEALQVYTENGAFFPLMYGLPGIALLLADQGEAERAVELYALASRYPLVANSRWFEDVTGKHIAAAAAALPPDVVAAAQERGRARDLDAAVAELLAELGE